jgi:hypothetical protein
LGIETPWKSMVVPESCIVTPVDRVIVTGFATAKAVR